MLTHSLDFLVDDTWERHVNTETFDKGCDECSREITIGHRFDDSRSDYYTCDIWWETDTSPYGPYDLDKLEPYFYYTGIRGHASRGPELVFRASRDVFPPPSGSHQRFRRMRLLPVYEHQKLSQDNRWATIRSKVVELLDQRDIKHSSIDLVRFSWDEIIEKEQNRNNEGVEENKDVEEDEYKKYANIKIAPYKKVVITPVTIWVGVLPDTLTREVASDSSNDILNLLKEHGIFDIEVAYRESVARSFSGPELFAPVRCSDPLQAVIDPVTTALGLPIAGLNTLKSQGTMGFFFRVDKALYAVTARHILFPEDQGNELHSYNSGPKKKVVLMGTEAFAYFLTSIKGHIGTQNYKISTLEEQVATLMARSEGGGSKAEQAASELWRLIAS
ncbi:unnamed protein product [Rhizoctonia solani]|uniref:Uncharacterized protein n=1 Tax=Rhizoctonia solani TaxID=456999 RepID=A0A8H3ABX7_9AGAM|nr:unnamed protein product [Rhizoctonia solani]